MWRQRLSLAAVLTTLLFSSCVDSEQPLSKPEDANRDDGLLGNWTIPNGVYQPPDPVKIIPIEAKVGPANLMVITSRRVLRDPKDKPGYCFVTLLDGKRYMLFIISKDEP